MKWNKLADDLVLFAITLGLMKVFLVPKLREFSQLPEGDFWRSKKNKGKSIQKSELV